MPQWASKTSQFGDGEMAMLEAMTAAELAAALLGSDPVVALRALAEVQLNGDTDKLDELLADADLTAYWQQYTGDSGVDERDRDYAEQLKARLPQ